MLNLDTLNFTEADLTDVPRICQIIAALREIGRRSETKTSRTQGEILRQLPAEVLTAVAIKMQEPSPIEAALAGLGGGK